MTPRIFQGASSRVGGAVAVLAAIGCSGGDGALPTTEDGSGSKDPVGSGSVSTDVADVLGDGSRSSVEMVVVYQPRTERIATDLAFNPTRPGELWAVIREAYDGRPCNEPTASSPIDSRACAQLEGRVAIIEGADTAAPVATELMDANAWHFMRRPTSIDFGDDETFATCGEHRTGNFDDGAADFMGPTLWTSDREVFGPDGPGGNGSHLDMLHATPFCMGIAHEEGNVYWTFNGQLGAVDRYDFREPHVPGGEDHSDGDVSRWLTTATGGNVVGELARVPDVPSHLVFDDETNWLYIADTGNRRILRLDTRSGREGAPMRCDDPQLDNTVERIEDARLEVVVGEEAALEKPSGLALHGGALYVTDNATSRITAFDLSGNEIQSLDTGLAAGSLAGIAFGPDGRLYFVDMQTSAVRRIDPL